MRIGRRSSKQRSLQSRDSRRYRREDKLAVVYAAERTVQREVCEAFGCSAASIRRWRDAPQPLRDEPNRLVNFVEKAGGWMVNPYWKCYHSCAYCVAHNQGHTRVWNGPRTVLSTLRRRLRDVPLERALILGGCADPYPPIEKHLGLTRTILLELKRQKRPLGYFGTKSGLICRDIDVLTNYCVQCCVYISVCSLDDAVLRQLEPGAPPAKERLERYVGYLTPVSR
jgi:hypothetical protein